MAGAGHDPDVAKTALALSVMFEMYILFGADRVQDDMKIFPEGKVVRYPIVPNGGPPYAA